MAAELTPANTADSAVAEALVCRMPAEVRYVLGDRHYTTPALQELCWEDERELVTTRYGRYPHTDGGIEVRRMFHKLRSTAIENFNEQFKGIFDGHGQVPTKGLMQHPPLGVGRDLGVSIDVCGIGTSMAWTCALA